MIQAKELRIGNWIKDIEGSELEFQVEARHIARSENYPCFRPIALEDDHFKRFGFEKYCGDYCRTGVQISDYEQWEGETIYRISISEWLGYVCPDIKYVHQLQNLFYALTGEELTYKP